ncbi:DUF5908 family protein [Sphingobacterium endophyticum]|uniref:DUF5908 family protein n=1 Tax=Sphingobacterium endophyticum TaxID=2546448 RepID=UPI0018CECB1E|nr:DUF5908 family protein [Sphingobacterium endophyticum]
MPVEVRELIIKATIVQELGSTPNSAASSQNNGINASEEIVKVCVDKVLEILKEKNER